MIPTLESYWHGPDTEDRRIAYAEEYEPQKDVLGPAAAETHRRIVAVASAFESATALELLGKYSSGWRPGKGGRGSSARPATTACHSTNPTTSARRP